MHIVNSCSLTCASIAYASMAPEHQHDYWQLVSQKVTHDLSAVTESDYSRLRLDGTGNNPIAAWKGSPEPVLGRSDYSLRRLDGIGENLTFAWGRTPEPDLGGAWSLESSDHGVLKPSRFSTTEEKILTESAIHCREQGADDIECLDRNDLDSLDVVPPSLHAPRIIDIETLSEEALGTWAQDVEGEQSTPRRRNVSSVGSSSSDYPAHIDAEPLTESVLWGWEQDSDGMSLMGVSDISTSIVGTTLEYKSQFSSMEALSESALGTWEHGHRTLRIRR